MVGVVCSGTSLLHLLLHLLLDSSPWVLRVVHDEVVGGVGCSRESRFFGVDLVKCVCT